MRILVYSPAFPPMVGGLEINTATLAEEMCRAGHEVVVVTATPSDRPDQTPYRVVRDPSRAAVVRWVRWCDVVLQQNVSLRGLWPLLLVHRPLVISHHSWYCRPDGRIAWQDRLKRLVARRARGSIAVSRAIAEDLRHGPTVVPNPYRSELFRRLSGVQRNGELLFVGRLVSDKGVDLLLDAMVELREGGLEPALTVVGEGPERGPLERQVAARGLSRVRFLGIRTGAELATVMNGHRILVVPSRYREPFGIVALEGIACGCLVIGSSGGGLPEAIGACGLTFRNGDAADLAAALRKALRNEVVFDAAEAERHLLSHRSSTVAARYLEVLESALGRPRQGKQRRVS